MPGWNFRHGSHTLNVAHLNPDQRRNCYEFKEKNRNQPAQPAEDRGGREHVWPAIPSYAGGTQRPGKTERPQPEFIPERSEGHRYSRRDDRLELRLPDHTD